MNYLKIDSGDGKLKESKIEGNERRNRSQPDAKLRYRLMKRLVKDSGRIADRGIIKQDGRREM